MTKGKLIELLADIPDTAEVVISYKNDTEFHSVHHVKNLHNRHALIETDENMNMDGMFEMAQAMLEDEDLLAVERARLEEMLS